MNLGRLEGVTAVITKKAWASAARNGSCEATAGTTQTVLSIRTSVMVTWPASFSTSSFPRPTQP